MPHEQIMSSLQGHTGTGCCPHGLPPQNCVTCNSGRAWGPMDKYTPPDPRMVALENRCAGLENRVAHLELMVGMLIPDKSNDI